MIIVPANPNAVQVGMIRTGCLKREFTSFYPTRLNGIISPDEFQTSISNINSKISSSKLLIWTIVVFISFIIVGTTLLTAGVISGGSRSSSYIILLVIGIVFTSVAAFFSSIAWVFIQYRRTIQMRQAIAEESKKYSTRSPVSCNWRLNVTRAWSGGYGRRNRVLLFYHIIIDIHPDAARSGARVLHPMQTSSRSTPTAPAQSEAPPPPYPGQPIAFCPQCGVPRHNLGDKFCTSCGHPFN